VSGARRVRRSHQPRRVGGPALPKLPWTPVGLPPSVITAPRGSRRDVQATDPHGVAMKIVLDDAELTSNDLGLEYRTPVLPQYPPDVVGDPLDSHQPESSTGVKTSEPSDEAVRRSIQAHGVGRLKVEPCRYRAGNSAHVSTPTWNHL
jgi:hypothetical protein